jgi:hypothetical protein
LAERVSSPEVNEGEDERLSGDGRAVTRDCAADGRVGTVSEDIARGSRAGAGYAAPVDVAVDDRRLRNATAASSAVEAEVPGALRSPAERIGALDRGTA